MNDEPTTIHRGRVNRNMLPGEAHQHMWFPAGSHYDEDREGFTVVLVCSCGEARQVVAA